MDEVKASQDQKPSSGSKIGAAVGGAVAGELGVQHLRICATAAWLQTDWRWLGLDGVDQLTAA